MLKELCEKTSTIKWTNHPEEEFDYIDLSSVSRDSLEVTTTIRVNENNAPSRAKKLVAKGDVIFATTRPTLKRVTLIADKYSGQLCSTGYSVLRSKPDQLYNRFLYYFIQGDEFIGRMAELERGTSYPAVTDSDVKSTKIRLPPLPEQRRLVHLLDTAFGEIERARVLLARNLVNAGELFDSISEKVFKQSMPTLKSNKVQVLKDVCEFIVDCEHKTAPTQATGYPSIRTPNIGKGHLILDGVKRVSEETYHTWSRRGYPEYGDLIMAREAPAGNVGVVPESPKVCLGQRTLLIRPKKDVVRAQFLAYYLLTPSIQKTLLGKSRGATVAHVNMKDIRNLLIDEFPKLVVQEKIEETIVFATREYEQLKKNYTHQLHHLTELKQSLLAKAFAGEL